MRPGCTSDAAEYLALFWGFAARSCVRRKTYIAVLGTLGVERGACVV